MLKPEASANRLGAGAALRAGSGLQGDSEGRLDRGHGEERESGAGSAECARQREALRRWRRGVAIQGDVSACAPPMGTPPLASDRVALR
jgi:hypothetical protein